MRTAAGFSTIPQRPAPSAGATTALVETARECGGRGRRKSGTPDHEIPSVARCEVESKDAGSGILPPDERQKLLAGVLVLAARPPHGRRHLVPTASVAT